MRHVSGHCDTECDAVTASSYSRLADLREGPVAASYCCTHVERAACAASSSARAARTRANASLIGLVGSSSILARSSTPCVAIGEGAASRVDPMTVMAVDATLHLCLSSQMVFLYSLPHSLQHIESWIVVQRPSINNKNVSRLPMHTTREVYAPF
jgi:hypothetical protein